LARSGDARRSAALRDRAQRIAASLERLWADEQGAFLAASADCRQVDVWGAAFALALDFPLGSRRARLVDFLARQFERIVQRGQVRHLLEPETWRRLFIPVPAGEYQNGAYWATASGWLWTALRREHPGLAQRLLEDLCADFAANGVYECVNGEYRKLDSYVVSATNIYGAVSRSDRV
jgi:hypothetical protein